mmetsp:Transcript_39252/g.76172  ORF Transcript_39252/g.76172 Transcript_39252/m.76172 type:complete len:205 (-) Transcript_39252:618-1232(-)
MALLAGHVINPLRLADGLRSDRAELLDPSLREASPGNKEQFHRETLRDPILVRAQAKSSVGVREQRPLEKRVSLEILQPGTDLGFAGPGLPPVLLLGVEITPREVGHGQSNGRVAVETVHHLLDQYVFKRDDPVQRQGSPHQVDDPLRAEHGYQRGREDDEDGREVFDQQTEPSHQQSLPSVRAVYGDAAAHAEDLGNGREGAG